MGYIVCVTVVLDDDRQANKIGTEGAKMIAQCLPFSNMLYLNLCGTIDEYANRGPTMTMYSFKTMTSAQKEQWRLQSIYRGHAFALC